MPVAPDARPLVSVVVPLWNEEAVVPALVERLRALLASSDVAWEFVFVDDGSTDGTLRALQDRAAGLRRWRIVGLSRNFGQQAAYRAGLDVARGDAVVFMDGDLQDPPETIPDLVRAWREGADVVVACRRSRKESAWRGLLFGAFHRLFAWLTREAMPAGSGTFGLASRRAADAMRQLPETTLFLPGLRSWVGFRQALVWYDRDARQAGRPRQSLRRLIAYAWDGVTSFSDRPLKAITAIGAGVFLFACGYAAALVAIKVLQRFGWFANLRVLGFTTLAVSIMGLGGVQLLCTGIIGEYIARIFREVKRRPLYLVDTIRSSEDAAGAS